jgi:ketose-bisphosphate aldolase
LREKVCDNGSATGILHAPYCLLSGVFMSLCSLSQLMNDAEQGGYAVGYFECWNLESLQAVVDAAQAERSPVIVGFNGEFLPDPGRLSPEDLSWYGALGVQACRSASVPCALIYNESPYLETIQQAAQAGFNIVMYANESLTTEELTDITRRIVDFSHARDVAVEAELGTLPYGQRETQSNLTDPDESARFVEKTAVDALAVSVGNVHVLVDGSKVAVDSDHVAKLKKAVPVPLVLHGATGVDDDSMREAIAAGIRMIHVGSVMKQAFLEAVHQKLAETAEVTNPHDKLGRGKELDLLMAGRLAVRDVVQRKIRIYGSSQRAPEG